MTTFGMTVKQPDWIWKDPTPRLKPTDERLLIAILAAAETVTTGRRSIWSIIVALWLSFVAAVAPAVVDLLERAATPSAFERKAAAWVGGLFYRIGLSLMPNVRVYA